jgi:hypothetical protein
MRRLVTFTLLTLIVAAGCGRTSPTDIPSGIRASTIWVDRDGDVGEFSSLAADSQGVPHVSYYDYTAGALKFARLSPEGDWLTETVDSEGDVGRHSSLAMDSLDYPHIAYFDVRNYNLKYAHFNGIEWERRVAFSDYGGRFASLALDANDVAHIAFITESKWDLLYMRWDAARPGSRQELELLDEGTSSGPSGMGGNIFGATSIAIQPETQRPVIAYYHASFGSLHVMAYMPDDPQARSQSPGVGWRQWVVDGGSFVGAQRDDAGDHASLFIEEENRFHISYFDRTNQNLKYALWEDDEQRWITETVDSDGLVGEQSSITVLCRDHPQTGERQCQPYISYFDSTNNDLKIATRRSNRGWITFRADLSGMTGTHSSITEISRGRVGVSYRDFTYSGLKFLVVLPF